MHIFIDESGSLQAHDGEGLIVFVAVATDKPHELRRIIRRTRRAKLRTKAEKRMSEVKGSTATDKFKKYLYRMLKTADFEIFVIYLRMRDIREEGWLKKAGVVRLRLTKKLLETAGAPMHDPLTIVSDRQPLPGMTARSFSLRSMKHLAAQEKIPRV